MMHIDTPNVSTKKTAEQNLQVMKSYMTETAETVNYNFSQIEEYVKKLEARISELEEKKK